MAKTKKKKVKVEMTLWDVCLSFPNLHDPKPFKGKVYYKTDCLLDEDHAQVKQLRAAIKKVQVDAFGEDKSEWPEGAQKKFLRDGSEREDQDAYKGKLFIEAKTQTPVPIVDLKGKAFNSQLVKGGMFANVAITISSWEFEGDEGIAVYLNGVQIDTSKASLNFGGGRSIKQMFGRDDDGDDDAGEKDDMPRGQKGKKSFSDEEE